MLGQVRATQVNLNVFVSKIMLTLEAVFNLAKQSEWLHVCALQKCS